MPALIVSVDDDKDILAIQQEILNDSGLQALSFDDPNKAWACIQENPQVRVVISDWEMPQMSGMDLLFHTRGLPTPPHFIFLTGHGSVDRAVDAMEKGAMSVLEKPIDPERFIDHVRKALYEVPASPPEIQVPAARERNRRSTTATTPIVRSSAMLQVMEMARAAAATDSTVLLLGESGTGKDVLARFIHQSSPRTKGPLVSINCGALPEHLMESELFGHEKGAFTGAVSRRVGRFEQAQDGSLFLDEVGDLLPALQVKLLRALQERVIERVGSNMSVPIDFRLICATHRDLGKRVEDGLFRQDLFYRINVVPIHLPALRDRVEDIEPLAQHFLAQLTQRLPAPASGSPEFSDEAIACLRAYAWPGNVRQLRNAVEYALVMGHGKQIEVAHLPQEVRKGAATADDTAPAPAATAAGNGTPMIESPGTLQDKMQSVESDVIRASLERHDWRIADVLEELKVSRSALYERMKTYGIKRPS